MFLGIDCRKLSFLLSNISPFIGIWIKLKHFFNNFEIWIWRQMLQLHDEIQFSIGRWRQIGQVSGWSMAVTQNSENSQRKADAITELAERQSKRESINRPMYERPNRYEAAVGGMMRSLADSGAHQMSGCCGIRWSFVLISIWRDLLWAKEGYLT